MDTSHIDNTRSIVYMTDEAIYLYTWNMSCTYLAACLHLLGSNYIIVKVCRNLLISGWGKILT